MIEATLCPSIFYCSKVTPLEVQKMCDKISHAWSLGESYNVDYIIPVHIFDQIAVDYPWTALFETNDNELRRSLTEIWTHLSRCQRSFAVKTCKPNTSCSCPYGAAFENWLGFLFDWEKTRSIKGITVESHCLHMQLETIFLVKDAEDWKYIKYPWLSKTDKKLPVEGEYPYVPPANWKSSSSLSTMHGGKSQYVDATGNFWCWDMMHRDHWDVTDHITKTHKNISVYGAILAED